MPTGQCTHDGVVDVGMAPDVVMYAHLLASEHQSGGMLVAPDTRVLDRAHTGSADRFGSDISRDVVACYTRCSEYRNECVASVAQRG